MRLFSAALVLVAGPPLLRLEGHNDAIATLGLNEAMREVVTNAAPLTGGGMGFSLPLPEGETAAWTLGASMTAAVGVEMPRAGSTTLWRCSSAANEAPDRRSAP